MSARAALAGAALADRLVCALNGVAGDRLEREGNPLRLRMALVFAGAAVPLRRDALAAAYPGATGRVALFVHGLSCDERMWAREAVARWGAEGTCYGSLLEEAHGYTPLYLRYNTGLSLAENGRALAALLGELAAAWPVPLERLVLIGHSMGGLVARSACHRGSVESAAWASRVSDVFCVGSPHLGAPLEKLGAVATALLGLHGVTAPFAQALDLRSVGIKDLRHSQSLGGESPDAPLRLPEGARLHLIGGEIGPRALGWALGDGMVRVGSATAPTGERVEATTLPGLNHMALMNHPAVWSVIERALAQG